MPLLKKAEGAKKPEWVVLANTKKQVSNTDNYVLGHQDIKIPAVVSTSNIKGVKARLVSVKKSASNKPPGTVDASNLTIIHEWEFDEDDQTKPVYFSSPVTINSDFWVEMINPTKNDAVVNALVHGLYMSKNL
jgi:hypothetical protein